MSLQPTEAKGVPNGLKSAIFKTMAEILQVETYDEESESEELVIPPWWMPTSAAAGMTSLMTAARNQHFPDSHTERDENLVRFSVGNLPMECFPRAQPLKLIPTHELPDISVVLNQYQLAEQKPAPGAWPSLDLDVKLPELSVVAAPPKTVEELGPEATVELKQENAQQGSGRVDAATALAQAVHDQAQRFMKRERDPAQTLLDTAWTQLDVMNPNIRFKNKTNGQMTNIFRAAMIRKWELYQGSERSMPLLTQKQWCEKEGLAYHTFRKWAKEPKRSQIVKLALREEKSKKLWLHKVSKDLQSVNPEERTMAMKLGAMFGGQTWLRKRLRGSDQSEEWVPPQRSNKRRKTRA